MLTRAINRRISIFILILLGGIFLRLYLIFTTNVFVDEVYHSEIALTNSVFKILKMEHWIKNHGVLYYLFLKLGILLTKDIVLLRLINLFLYVILSLATFIIFNSLNISFFLSLVPVGLLAFSSYFVYINSMISPFNSVMTFAILSIFLIFYIIGNNLTKKGALLFLILFPLLSILAFYSGNSFFYIFPTYIIAALILFISNKEKFLIFMVDLLIMIIFIIPAIPQIITDFDLVGGNLDYYKIATQNYLTSGLFHILNNFLNTILLRTDGYGSLILFSCLVFLSLFLIFKNRLSKGMKLIIGIVTASLILNIIVLLIFTKYVFFLLVERSFWYFYFLLTMLLSLCLIGFAHYKKTFAIIFFIFIILLNLSRYSPTQSFHAWGKLPYDNFNFRSLVNNLIKNKIYLKPGKLICLSEVVRMYPVCNYYFSSSYHPNDVDQGGLRIFLKEKEIQDLNGISSPKLLQINKLLTYSSNTQLIILVTDFESKKIKKYLRNSDAIKNKIDIYLYTPLYNMAQLIEFKSEKIE